MTLRIKSIYGSLTHSEKRVANIILTDPIGITKKSVKEIAAEASVAPSAVIRFCKKTGVDGLLELKNALIEEFTKGEDKFQQALPISQGDSISDIVSKTFQLGENTLRNTLKMLDFQEIERIIEKIIVANRVVCFGVGTSSVIATDAHYRFSQLGISCSYCSDILFMNVTTANLTENDLAIFISHSGQTKATVDAMRQAKEKNATTVAISSYSNSLLAKESDHAIIAFSDAINYPVEAVSASIAHMCIVDSLMMAIAKKKFNALPEFMTTRNKALTNIRY